MTKVVPFPWDAFGQMQAAADSVILTSRNHARDEALGQILDDHARGVGPADADALQRRFQSLAANRAKKYRRRAAVARHVAARLSSLNAVTDIWEAVELQELVDFTMRELVGDELVLADCLRRELSYDEIATEVGKPIGTVKAQVSRMRSRIRGTKVGQYILTVLAA
jgi:DNA-binding NarL/FixJ family response regulator